ncbi:MAG: GTPase HflX [Acidobacteria bacterium]|jgi:GTP-binding protein HflX|nr:GTPase HflX [Acidobacteriota bacterium]
MPVERAIACGCFPAQKPEAEIASAMVELQALCRSAGAVVAGKTWQKRPAPDRRLLIGQGKVEEVRRLAAAQGADLVVFHNVLTTLQQRNLEDSLGLKVIDRSRLILDIFAARARSQEGKLQVELAQLLYLLPRLTGKGVTLSRLGGGIGTRGPGESKLESDRRQIKMKIARIRQKLKGVSRNRDLQRQNRRSLPVPLVSLVGYTSAGKSTLFKALTGENVFISQELFATLDPLLRRVDLHDAHPGYYFILSDTVGFIRDMPAELFISFTATLDEVRQADLVLHVVDLTHPDWPGQKNEVEKVLRQLEIDPARVIPVFNKIDLREDRESLAAVAGSGIYVSAMEKTGLAALKEEIFQRYFADYGAFTVVVADEQQLDALGRWAIVLEKNRVSEGFQAAVLCSLEKMLQFKETHGGAIR